MGKDEVNNSTGSPSRDDDSEDPIAGMENIPDNLDYSWIKNVEISVEESQYFERDVASTEEIRLMKQKLAEDVEKVKKILDQLEDYFKKTVEQLSINRREFEITIPISYGTMQFVTILSVTPTWIFIKCKVMGLEEVTEKIKLKLFESILMSNFELNAVFYSVDPDKTGIWIENDIPTSLSMEGFDLNFNAIVFGIKYFVDNIAQPLNQEIKSTFDQDHLYT